MFSKLKNPLAVRVMKGLIALEILGVFGAYGLFQMMNSSQDFRGTMNRKFPSILEVYYQSNEWSGIYGIRERDEEAWGPKQE
ncbi:protein CEBPZOS-like [Halichoeres trimaculatus]|uniref:protein CEBPZOS-like n=1 Tax=Halichoeres trimaculatus TaxID=147232 RepID=UPI003D9F07AF